MSSAGGAAISGSEGKGVVEIVVRSVVAVRSLFLYLSVQ